MPRDTLYDAASFNDRPAADALLARDPARVNERDRWGFTPLHGAAGGKHVDMLRYLVARGADVNVANDGGTTPLHLAACPHIAQALIEAGAVVDARDGNDDTPLHVAAAHPEMRDVVECLIGHGADVNAVNREGRTPLDYALARKDGDKAALLRQHDARRGAAR